MGKNGILKTILTTCSHDTEDLHVKTEELTYMINYFIQPHTSSVIGRS